MWTVKMEGISAVSDALKELEPGGKTQKFFTNQIWSVSNEYVPMKSSTLKTSATLLIDGTGILYNTPYARYHWYGKLMVDPVYKKGAFFSKDYGFWSRPNIPKELTDIDLTYQDAPKRGARWCERAFMDNKDAIIKATAAFAARGK